MPYLALFFRQELALAFLPPTHLAGLEAGGVRYRALTGDEIGTHYDRLVDRAGRLVGFQLWAVPADLGLEGLLGALGPRPYLEPLGGVVDGGCTGTVVHVCTNAGTHSSLQLGGGKVHVSCHRLSGGDLRYAQLAP